MNLKYQNRYRISSARADWWDYGWNSSYFITICTAHREHFFGEIKNMEGDGIENQAIHFDDNNGAMQLSDIGEIAIKYWWSITEHFSSVVLDAFVVMPNHIHGILILDKLDDGRDRAHDSDRLCGRDGACVETGHALSLLQQLQQQKKIKTPGQLRYGNQGKETVSSIIGSYKSAVSKHAHQLNPDFDWQKRFHDHIIRDEPEFDRISTYIQNNPSNWKKDKFYNY